MAFNIPHSAGKFMAFGGMGIAGFGMWQMVTLLQQRQRTMTDLVSWAEQERIQAIVVGLLCMAIGAILVGGLLWSFIGVMQSGSPIPVRPVPIGVGIGLGGVLIWLGAMLIKLAIGGKSKY
ncbi:hypothetical protein [Chamaesiphon sp. VAR_48_metabat_135_sub]|uniref:hypothetical protein n=1 Tax=Chamaesiphon sp. VAR_48_metabat_135_sub TaxID=2964699 RepID=UPI00286B935B|nr:hypothetical protein [Chamaesiphon sp. VAR_48_metabat_135_sub]